MKAWQGSVAVSRHTGIVSPAYFTFTLGEAVYPRFLHYQLRSRPYVALYRQLSKGIRPNQWDLEPEAFGRIVVFLPSRNTQTAIADFLDRKTAAIDTLIEKKERMIELLAEKRIALVHRAVTKGLDPNARMKDSGVPWIGEIPEHWEISRAKSLVSFSTSGSRGWAVFYTDDDCAPVFLQSGNLGANLALNFSRIQYVDPPRSSEGSRTFLLEGDVLICITGAKTGNVALATDLPERVFINQHIALLRPRQKLVNSSFLAHALKSDPSQQQLEATQYGGTKQGLGLEDVGNVQIALPPLAEQRELISLLEKRCHAIVGATTQSRRQIDRLKEYRQALITQAVTGQLEIPVKTA